jgi:ketosteroid isomerase-like protein
MTVDDVRSLIGRVQAAINAHDLEAFLACFDEAYDSKQPLRPEHSFRGREGVRRNWSANLARVPDLRWDPLDAHFGADEAWCEWRRHGTRLDGTRFDVSGVVIYGIEDGRIVRGRLYVGYLPEDTDTKEER